METNNPITPIQFMFLIIIFMLGTSDIVPPAGEAKQESWIVLLGSMLWSVLLFSIYLKLKKKYPGKTILEMLETAFGKWIGKFIAIVYVTFFILLTSLILNNSTSFIQTNMPETPSYVLNISFMIIATYTLKRGFSYVGNMIMIIAPFIIGLIIFNTLVSSLKFSSTELLPMFELGAKPLLLAFIHASGWPFGEVILFTMLFPLLQTSKQLNKFVYRAIVIGGLLLIMISVRNTLILGKEVKILVTYPSRAALNIAEIPGLGSLSLFVPLAFLSGVFIKMLVCLYASIIGLSYILALKNYKIIIFPMAIFISYLANIVYKNYAETLFFGINIYAYYIFPLSLIIPLSLLLFGKKTVSNRI